MKRLVVGGSGHCGTAWLTLALNFLGIPATHEGVFTMRGKLHWPSRLRADVSLASSPYMASLGSEYQRALLVRNPLQVLNSFMRGWTFAAHCPCHLPGEHLGSPLAHYAMSQIGVEICGIGTELDRTVAYIVGSNELALNAGAPVWRIEDLTAPRGLLLVAEVLGIELDEALDLDTKKAELLPSNLNAHGYLGEPRPEFTWGQLAGTPAGARLIEHAWRLGYETPHGGT